VVQAPLVLVTGSAGRIGQAVVRELVGRGWPVRGFDRVPTPGLADALVGNITDPAAVAEAVAGAGTVVHLAATPDDDDFLTQLLPNNLVGPYHVLEAARAAGVGRLVLASSGQVTWWQRERGPWPIRADDLPTPRSWYAAAKLFVEAAGKAFAESFGLSVIVARLGWCPRSADHARELAETPWGPDVYLSPGDAGRFFACAVAAPDHVRHAIVYATSRPVQRPLYDLEPARVLLGYEPQDRWPTGLSEPRS
jgi:nucleoside-diphosphate-sugar epimerase